ncbi:MAG: hypothetical protein FWG94_01135, partial [Oscillospiraceae bacterium]|nr:hypothetical protein [Oscillospiraceae bacterium]
CFAPVYHKYEILSKKAGQIPAFLLRKMLLYAHSVLDAAEIIATLPTTSRWLRDTALTRI